MLRSEGRLMGGKRRYGCSAGTPEGVAENKTRCIREVWLNDRAGSHHQCRKRRGHGPDGLYCRQHDPLAIAAKQTASELARSKKDQEQHRIEAEARRLSRALGVKGRALYVSTPRFKDCGVVEELVISFKDAEKIAALLRRLDQALANGAF